MISKIWLEKHLIETDNKRGSAIIIIVGNEVEALQLCVKGLKFGRAPKIVEKYWKAGPSFICMACSDIVHDRLGGYKERPEQCIICADAHKTKNHRVGVTGCAVKKGKIYIYVVPQYANCDDKHQAIAFKCLVR